MPAAARFSPGRSPPEHAAGADKEVPAAGGTVYRRQPFAVFDIQPQRRVGFIVNAAVHRHLHPAIAINTRQQRTQGTPGFAVPILPVHRNALFLRIHPIALQGQRRVGEGTGGAGDGGQGSSARGAGNVITWAVLSMVCAEYTRLAALCRPNLTVFCTRPESEPPLAIKSRICCASLCGDFAWRTTASSAAVAFN